MAAGRDENWGRDRELHDPFRTSFCSVLWTNSIRQRSHIAVGDPVTTHKNPTITRPGTRFPIVAGRVLVRVIVGFHVCERLGTRIPIVAGRVIVRVLAGVYNS